MKRWDAVVIGTGMGGATLGYALAAAGKKVLFLEKGLCPLRAAALRGDYAETFYPPKKISETEQASLLKRAGRFWETIWDVSAREVKPLIPFIGTGAGGSTSLYGAVLERFEPADFTPQQYFPEDCHSSLPSRWPISYEELLPYYGRAETLFGVGSTHPPLPAVQSDEESTLELMGFFSAKGLRPYRLPVAHDSHSRCPGCQGFLCSDNKKRDSLNACLIPALRDHNASLIDDCAVQKLMADANAVNGVVCSIGGQEAVFKADVVILAAGALETPRILLQSQSELWPEGLANSSGLVGKNLMRHFVDLYVVSTHAKPDPRHHQKDIGLKDFYVVDGVKYGAVQSFGKLPPASVIVRDLENRLRNSSFKRAGIIFPLVRPWLAWLLNQKFSRSVIMASILEDRPYPSNRVLVSDASAVMGQGKILLNYRIQKKDKLRIQQFRALMKKVLAPYRVTLIKAAEDNERLAHACGTCRMGNDPADSVLDKDNKAHGLSNLYVVDASFFPSSGGINPSLTLAANALRVAERILASFYHLQESAISSSVPHTANSGRRRFVSQGKVAGVPIAKPFDAPPNFPL